MPYNIILSSIIFPKYTPKTVRMIKVMIIQKTNANSREQKMPATKNGETINIVANAGKILSTNAANIFAD